MIDCFRGAWRRGAGLSEPGRSGAGPRAYWRAANFQHLCRTRGLAVSRVGGRRGSGPGMAAEMRGAGARPPGRAQGGGASF